MRELVRRVLPDAELVRDAEEHERRREHAYLLLLTPRVIDQQPPGDGELVRAARARDVRANMARTARGALQKRTSPSRSARTVQAFAAEEREKDRYREKIGDPDSRTLFIPLKKEERKSTTYGIGLSKAWWTSGFYTWIFGVGFGSLYVSLWYGFKLVNSGQMTLGQVRVVRWRRK